MLWYEDKSVPPESIPNDRHCDGATELCRPCVVNMFSMGTFDEGDGERREQLIEIL